ncbi:hypothetical protein ACFWY9_29040 [Amycolatopsis sp. NPDC059027]|uniref:hypothetical protein n=1 Tax=unclassified Amycolatopsis TaxID=2618356 RepID=UPI00366E32DB
MAMVARRVVDDVEYAMVLVEHLFDLDEAVLSVMGAKSTVRPRPGTRVVPLKTSEVRAALQYTAQQGGRHHEIVARFREEEPGGPLHLLADWIRSELVRLGIFTADQPAASPR